MSALAGTLRAAIAAFFDLPPAVVAFSIVILTVVCYFVLPPRVGLPLVALFAPLPWYEERLAAWLARRGERPQNGGRP